MSTGINIASSSGLTVGTTTVTSGTDGRVFFQAGGVVQQDANFTFDNTLKRLALKASGATVTDIPFRIRNSADNADLFIVYGTKAFTLGNSVSSDGFTTYLGTAGGVTQITASGNGLSLTSNFASALNATNNVSIQTNGLNRLYFDNAGLIGVGNTTPGARLDVRAQGALSTDIAFRVRNSADTVDLYRHQGDGGFTFRNNANTKFFYWDASNLFQFGTIGGQTLNVDVQSTAITRIETTSDILLEGVSTHKFIQYKNGNFQLEEASGIAQTSGAGGFSMKNAATIPSASSTDRFIMYSTDITAGNAAPHFRTENGAIVKVYQETTGVGASTLVTGLGTPLTDTDTFDGYTLKQIVKALRNQGLLA
jgi:hypothetical protein